MNTENYGQRKKLIDCFLEKNSQINLSAIRTPEGVYKKHILDSLELLNAISMESSLGKLFQNEQTTMLDVGTGGGFPLLPLAISFPEIQCFGIDARRKKAHAVNDIADLLWIENVEVVRGRAEEHKKTYDIVTARSVAYADKIFQRTEPLIKKGGYLILYKLFTHEEDDAILRLVRQKQYTLIDMHHYTLPGEETERIIYIIQKT